MDNGSTTMAWRTVTTALALVGGTLTKKMVGSAWRSATGGEPPVEPENPDTTWSQALVWAVITGAAMGVVKLILTRGAASSWRSATGALPPGIGPVQA
ncbi:MAG: DUF4235 domain-containing protein [Sporichthyaceae bacterium]